MPDLEAAGGAHAVTGLAEVLKALGDELRQAHAEGGQTILFGSAEVELDVAAEANAAGGVKFWVLNVEGGATYTRTARVKVILYPGGDQPYGVGK